MAGEQTDTSGTSGSTTTTTQGAGQGEPWYKGADDVIVGIMQNRGWDKKPANEVALEVLKSYSEAEKQRGFPSAEVLRYKPADADVMKGFYGRLGVPSDASKYEFNDIKLPDGSELDPAFTDALRGVAFEQHLTPDQARAVTQGLIKFVDGMEKQSATEVDASISAEREALKQKWGADTSMNLLMAQEGARAMGFDADIVNALEKVSGYAKVMEAMRSVGQRLREPGSIGQSGGTGVSNGVMTREQAQSRKQELMADAAWRGRWYSNGKDGPEAREMFRLDQIISR